VRKKAIILVGLIFFIAAGAGFYFGKKMIPPPKPAISEWEALFSYAPVDPVGNYFAAVVDIEAFQEFINKWLTPKEKMLSKLSGLKKAIIVAWPKEGIFYKRRMHYAFVSSAKEGLGPIRERLIQASALEQTCAEGVSCYEIPFGRNSIYVGFKGKKYLMASDTPETLGIMLKARLNIPRGKNWNSKLSLKDEWFGAFLFKASRDKKELSPALSSKANLFETLTIYGYAKGVSDSIEGVISVSPKTEKGKTITAKKIAVKWDFSPSLPKDILILGVDLDALQEAVSTEASSKGLSGKGILELSFEGSKPLFYLEVKNLSEESPWLKKMGKPGEKIDATRLMPPIMALFFGNTSLFRKKGGFILTNLPDPSSFKPSEEGLAVSRDLLMHATKTEPAAFIVIAPQRLSKGILDMLRPLFRNPSLSDTMKKLEKSQSQKVIAERILILARSPFDYEIKIKLKSPNKKSTSAN